MARRKKENSRNAFWRLAFLIYCVGMLWLLFGQRMGTAAAVENINLQPLKTIRLYLELIRGSNGYLVRHAFVNLVGNVVMFIPVGYLLPRIWKRLRGFFKMLLITTGLVLLVEILQYYTGLGSCDIDDLILNIPGAMIGYILWKWTGGRT